MNSSEHANAAAGNPQEYVSLSALEHALCELMRRRGVSSWLETAFDANDINLMIHEIPDEHIIVMNARD